jgi:hypothetical protein
MGGNSRPSELIEKQLGSAFLRFAPFEAPAGADGTVNLYLHLSEPHSTLSLSRQCRCRLSIVDGTIHTCALSFMMHLSNGPKSARRQDSESRENWPEIERQTLSISISQENRLFLIGVHDPTIHLPGIFSMYLGRT